MIGARLAGKRAAYSVCFFLPVFAVIFFCTVSLKAQTAVIDCSSSLQTAEHQYEQGEFREVIETLTPCLEQGLNNDDAWRGYRLVAISYLLIDQPDSADVAIHNMLARNPTYEANPSTDPYEFAKAIGRFGYYPQSSVGAEVGLLDPQFQLLTPYSVTQVSATQASYSTKIQTTFGLSAEYRFTPRFGLTIAGLLTPLQFTRTTEPVRGVQIDYTESISSISIPLIAHLDIAKNAFQPFIEAGAFAQFFTSATATLTPTIANQVQGASGASSLSNINSLDRRQAANYGFVLGAGVSHTLSSPGSEVRLSARYWNGLRALTKLETRYSDPTLYERFYYVDDQIVLRGIQLNLSFIFHIHLTEYRESE